jgi:hypothetical protein
VAAHKEQGTAFVDIFFGDLSVQYYRYLRVPSLVSILWDIYKSPLSLSARPEFACAELLAEEFLEEFWTSTTKKMSDAAHDRIAATSLNEGLQLAADRPQSLLDSVFLIAITEHEFIVRYFNGHFPGVVPDGLLRLVIGVREKRIPDNEADLSEIPLSEKTKNFLESWMRGEVHVFADSKPLGIRDDSVRTRTRAAQRMEGVQA